MKTAHRVVILLVVLLVSSVRPASALGFMSFVDFLDHLSGPGPFVGVGVDLSLVCDDGAKGTTATCLWRTGRLVPDQGRVFEPRRFEVGPHISWLNGQVNPDLIYDPAVPDQDRHVNALTYGGHAYFWFRQAGPRLGATVRVTAVRFTGAQVRDGSITRTMVSFGPIIGVPLPQRLRLDVSPLVQLGLGRFTAGDFGALGPALSSDNVKVGLHLGVRF